jgi:phage tail sheath protein FI
MEANRIHDAAVTLCERLQDRFVILDCPPLREIEEIVRWRRRVDSSYAAYYSPWVHVTRDDGQRVLVPPSGHVAGVFARCDREAGVHKAPANEVLKGISGVSLAFTETDQGILNSELVNCLRPCPGRGTRVWGARTCSSDQSWRYVNVRRLFIMLRRTFEHQTQWAVFEPNDAGTWSKLSRMGSVFLEDLYSKGYFAGASPEEAFFVKCDAETNTAESRDVGQLVVEVGVAPALPAEFIIFRVTQQLGDQAVMAAAVPGG